MTTKVRRVVTGHDQGGRAIVASDGLAPASGLGVQIWSSTSAPADNQDPADGGTRPIGLTLEGGSVFRVMDMEPGHVSPMHRSHSLDYGIVMEGEIEMVLDEGEVVRLAAGDVVVQRGTIHAWRNVSDKNCRMGFILLDAKPIAVDGKPLPTEMHGVPDAH